MSRVLVTGKIRGFEPFVRAVIGRSGTLNVGSRGPINLIVDTGFSGAVSLGRSVLRRLKVRREGFERFRLEDGRVVTVPIYSGFVRMGRKTLQT